MKKYLEVKVRRTLNVTYVLEFIYKHIKYLHVFSRTMPVLWSEGMRTVYFDSQKTWFLETPIYNLFHSIRIIKLCFRWWVEGYLL